MYLVLYTAYHPKKGEKTGSFRTRSSNHAHVANRIKRLCRGFERASYVSGRANGARRSQS